MPTYQIRGLFYVWRLVQDDYTAFAHRFTDEGSKSKFQNFASLL